MRALIVALTMFIAMPAFAYGDYQAADGNSYYRITFNLTSDIQLTAGVFGDADGINYSEISAPEAKDARHYAFTADINQVALSLHSYEKIVKAEFLPTGSIYISGDGPTLHLSTIQTREAWKSLPVSNDGKNVSLEGLDQTTNVTLPALSNDAIIAATHQGATRELLEEGFWLGLAKECRIKNGELTGACRLYVNTATVKLTFEHQEPVLLTIDYIIGC